VSGLAHNIWFGQVVEKTGVQTSSIPTTMPIGHRVSRSIPARIYG
jgi:hypothetical protein